MSFKEFIKSRKKKAVLFFLAGFFSGGILYYLCQKPAGEALAHMEENMLLWAMEEQDFVQALLFIIWERAKVFSVLWLAGYTKIYKFYIRAFIVFAGIQSGFLLTFFVMLRGTKGVLFWMITGVPHLFFLVPLYIYSFYRILERRREKQMPAVIMILFVFVLSCVLEARINVPLVQWMYRS